MSNIIEWLESPEGEAWSRDQHKASVNILLRVKDDNSEFDPEDPWKFGWVLWSTDLQWGYGWEHEYADLVRDDWSLVDAPF